MIKTENVWLCIQGWWDMFSIKWSIVGVKEKRQIDNIIGYLKSKQKQKCHTLFELQSIQENH